MANETIATVKQNGKGDFGLTINVGKHTVYADLPEAKGGQDSGPNPYELLTSSLGACTSLMVRFIANKKKIPLEGVETVVKHWKDESGKDCFDRQVTLKGSLTDEQRATLLQAAEDCAVHKTLHNGSAVETKLAA